MLKINSLVNLQCFICLFMQRIWWRRRVCDPVSNRRKKQLSPLHFRNRQRHGNNQSASRRRMGRIGDPQNRIAMPHMGSWINASHCYTISRISENNVTLMSIKFNTNNSSWKWTVNANSLTYQSNNSSPLWSITTQFIVVELV